MATQKPISTISYNTEAFLREKLDTWYNAHIIQAYQYMKHKGEDGDKDHIHVRIEPNKKLDPMDLLDELKEFQIGKDKPLGCRPFRPSKEEDWVLYACHDKKYLQHKYGGCDKGEKLPYKWEDIVTNDGYDVETMYIRAKSKLEHTSSNLADKLRSGVKPIKLIEEGENPYVINALVHAMATNDYTTLAKAYRELQTKYNKLERQYAMVQDALAAANMVSFFDEEAKTCIIKPYDLEDCPFLDNGSQ